MHVQDDELSPVEVFSGTIIEAEMVKNMLENENIEAYIWNEVQGISQVIGIFNTIQIVVPQHEYQKARAIVEEYWKNMK